MPTTYTDQFWLIDPYSPPPRGTTLEVVSLDIVDQNDNNLINRSNNDTIDGVDITAAYPGDTITVRLESGERVTITGTTFYLADGRRVFTPTDGSVLEDAVLLRTTWEIEDGSMPVGDLGPPCFVSGTLVEVAGGMKPVETLSEGDEVTGYGGETLTLKKTLRRRFDARALATMPKLRPVRIMAGALGGGLPRRDLLVSRQHRMLIRSKIAERMFGETEVLIPAIKLTALPGIYIDESVDALEYVHLLFDQHEVIYAEGAPTESLFTGPEALKSVSPEAREEILTIFPEAAALDYAPDPARFIPPGKRQKQLIARHLKNRQPLLAQVLGPFSQ